MTIVTCRFVYSVSMLTAAFFTIQVLFMFGLGMRLSVYAAEHKGSEIVAIIGTGDLGDSVGESLAKLGHKIVYGSRDPSSDKAKDVVARTGNGATVTTQKDAAKQGDIIFLAVGWPAMEQVAQSLGDLSGKIVADGSFPYQQAEDGYMESMVETSSAELIKEWNPDAKVLKWSLPASNWIDVPSTIDDGGKIGVWIAGDDKAAKEKLAQLTYDMGLEPFDAGPLRVARDMEAQVNLYMVPFVQGRKETWDYIVRRSNFFPCMMAASGQTWFEPVFDADDLASFPTDDAGLKPCPGEE